MPSPHTVGAAAIRGGRAGCCQTLTRAGRVLDLFTPERHEWGVTAVAVELGIANRRRTSSSPACARSGYCIASAAATGSAGG